MNKPLLESKMKLHNDNQSTLAGYLNISLSRLNAKINETGGAEFNQGEIARIKARYNLTPDDIDQIFFTSEVS